MLFQCVLVLVVVLDVVVVGYVDVDLVVGYGQVLWVVQWVVVWIGDWFFDWFSGMVSVVQCVDLVGNQMDVVQGVVVGVGYVQLFVFQCEFLWLVEGGFVWFFVYEIGSIQFELVQYVFFVIVFEYMVVFGVGDIQVFGGYCQFGWEIQWQVGFGMQFVVYVEFIVEGVCGVFVQFVEGVFQFIVQVNQLFMFMVLGIQQYQCGLGGDIEVLLVVLVCVQQCWCGYFLFVQQFE